MIKEILKSIYQGTTISIYNSVSLNSGGSNGKKKKKKKIHLPMQETWFNPWVRKISWRRKWQPTPIFLPGKFHRHRSLAGCSPWSCKELDTTEQLSTHTHTSSSSDNKAKIKGRLFFHSLQLYNEYVWREKPSFCSIHNEVGQPGHLWRAVFQIPMAM